MDTAADSERGRRRLSLPILQRSSMIAPEEKQQLAAALEGAAVADADGAVRKALERLQQLEQERKEREVAALAEAERAAAAAALLAKLDAAAVTYYPAERGLAAPVPGTGGQFLAMDDVVLLRDGLPRRRAARRGAAGASALLCALYLRTQAHLHPAEGGGRAAAGRHLLGTADHAAHTAQ